MTFPMPYVVPYLGVGEITITDQPGVRHSGAGVSNAWAIGAIRSVQSGDFLNGSFLPEIPVPGSNEKLIQISCSAYTLFGVIERYYSRVLFSGSVTNSQWSGVSVNGVIFPRGIFTERTTGSGSWISYTHYSTPITLLKSDVQAWFFDHSLTEVPKDFPSYLDGSKHTVEVIA